MNALLLAAGLGTRLKPITNKIPKPLVKIGDKPILEIWINKLFALGINKILINTHYLPEKIENLVKTGPNMTAVGDMNVFPKYLSLRWFFQKPELGN